jgi:hypothetical protein
MKLRATAVVVAAEASAQRLRASVTVANPVVQAQVAYATASTTAEIHSASVTYVVPVAAIAHINLVVGVMVDDSGRYPFIADTVVMLESLSFSTSKLLTDAATMQENHRISTAKPFSDGWSVADAVSLRPEPFKYDSVGTSDNDTYVLEKGLRDTPVVVETLYFSVEKLLTDGVGMNDSFDLNDGSTYTFAKAINNVSFATDAMAKDLQRGVLEAVSVSSAGVLVNQNYCDITYFAEDYVGDSRTFT